MESFYSLTYPVGWFDNLGRLRELDLELNSLASCVTREPRGLPPGIASCTRLTWLSFEGNHMKSLPPDLCKLTWLRHLNLSYNQLTNEAFPAAFTSLRRLICGAYLCHLESLSLRHCHLRMLPAAVDLLPEGRLMLVDLADNDNISEVDVRQFDQLRRCLSPHGILKLSSRAHQRLVDRTVCYLCRRRRDRIPSGGGDEDDDHHGYDAALMDVVSDAEDASDGSLGNWWDAASDGEGSNGGGDGGSDSDVSGGNSDDSGGGGSHHVGGAGNSDFDWGGGGGGDDHGGGGLDHYGDGDHGGSDYVGGGSAHSMDSNDGAPPELAGYGPEEPPYAYSPGPPQQHDITGCQLAGYQLASPPRYGGSRLDYDASPPTCCCMWSPDFPCSPASPQH